MLASVLSTLTAAAIAVGGGSIGAAPEAYTADFPVTLGAVTNNCGTVTCSTYISRSGTRAMDDFLDGKVAQYGAWGAEVGVCGRLAPVPYVGPPLAVYCGFRFAQFDQVLDEAADRDRCFKITYLPNGTVTHISTNNGDYCKD